MTSFHKNIRCFPAALLVLCRVMIRGPGSSSSVTLTRARLTDSQCRTIVRLILLMLRLGRRCSFPLQNNSWCFLLSNYRAGGVDPLIPSSEDSAGLLFFLQTVALLMDKQQTNQRREDRSVLPPDLPSNTAKLLL